MLGPMLTTEETEISEGYSMKPIDEGYQTGRESSGNDSGGQK